MKALFSWEEKNVKTTERNTSLNFSHYKYFLWGKSLSLEMHRNILIFKGRNPNNKGCGTCHSWPHYSFSLPAFVRVALALRGPTGIENKHCIFHSPLYGTM